uniref:Uncharacterized protein n=1 Tax=Tanacetum cinerariifolium TaxID=118510 RepID=A0A6L2L9A4_TANCI|nr:hypothetical protein [Tanacetum cinerariifolium]
MAKTINGEAQLHALVDDKEIIITKLSVRRYLRLADEEGIDCLPIFTIIKQLTLTGVESSGDEESLDEDASKQGRIDAIDGDEEITLVNVQDDADKEMFDVNVLDLEVINTAKLIIDVAQVSAAGDIVSTASILVSTASVLTTVSAATTTTATITTVDDITLAQALEEIKSTKPKEKGINIQELGNSTPTKSLQQSHDKGKRIMIELVIEPLKPIKRKDQIRLDEEAAFKLQAAIDEKERLTREKAEKNASTRTRRFVYCRKTTLFQQLLEKKRKQFAAKRAKEKRNKPPTKAQHRKIMCTYLKNIEGYKLKDLKLKEFDSIKEMFDRAFKRVNAFEDFRIELVEGKEKRAGTELIQEITKKQKVEDDKETTELKQFMEIIPDEEEVAIDVIPLSVKSPKIVDWKIYKEGRKSYYQIIRADGKSQMYMVFSQMLKSFDRIYTFVEKKYPLASPTLLMMLEKKLIVEYESEMACQLL